ncbi:gp53-like domain-containing protein [Morganella morganii]|uniref:gp53-like domain-containing protein n=1 Tax=Morganella morganii TaxID=582 RepID=UPI003D6FEB6E
MRVSTDGYYLNLFDGKDYRRIYLPFKAGEAPLKAEVDAELAKKGNKNTALNAENGWWKCGDTGKIIQHGRAIGKNGDVIYYPIPFPTAVAAVILMDIKGPNLVTATSRTQYGFAAATAGGAIEFNFIAIGY